MMKKWYDIVVIISLLPHQFRQLLLIKALCLCAWALIMSNTEEFLAATKLYAFMVKIGEIATRPAQEIQLKPDNYCIHKLSHCLIMPYQRNNCV